MPHREKSHDTINMQENKAAPRKNSAGMTRPPAVVAPPSPTALMRPPSRPSSAAAVVSPSKRAAPSKMLYAKPHSIHFSGFALDQTYTQRVVVHNNSAKPVRMQFTLPAKAPFRVSFPSTRKPFVSPGLYEELLVTFKPSAFQYYTDCIHVKCEEIAYASNADAALVGTCTVPLHAYPVANAVSFPSRMDFGVVPLATVARRHVDLACSVPIEFEYELRIVKPHAAFTIFPLTGVIPAHGTARIELEFKPLQYATLSAEVELRVSQLGFQPLFCVLTGSSSSDVPVEVQESATTPTNQNRRQQQRPRTADPDNSPTAQPKSPTRRHQSNANNSTPTSKQRQQDDQQPEQIGSVQIPTDLDTVASVSFILTQQPGKLKPKDLKKAIDANRRLRQQQQDEQAKLSLAVANHSDSEDDRLVKSPAVLSFHVLVREEAGAIAKAGVSRQIRELAFLQDLSEIDTIEKQLEFQSHKIRLGQELLTDSQLDVLYKMRELNTLELQRRERERLRHDVESKGFNMFTPPTPDTPTPPRGSLPAHFMPTIVPDFKSYKNDLWSRRQRVVRRLIRAISTVIIRNRAQRRLDKLQHWLAGAKTRAQVKEKVALDWQRHASASSSSTAAPSKRTPTVGGTSDTNKLASVVLPGFPVVQEQEHRERHPVALKADDWDLQTDPFGFFPLRDREEALVMGHEQLELPPLPTYVALESERQLRTGAPDECAPLESASPNSNMGTNIKYDLKTSPVLALLPNDVFLRPSAALRPLVRIQRHRETEVTWVLRPQRVFRSVPTHWGLKLDTGVGTRSLFARRSDLLRLYEVYQPRTERNRGVPPLLLVPGDQQSQANSLYRSLWDVDDAFLPPLSQRPQDVPSLSDSESDDEEAAQTPRQLPTWDDAVQLWGGDAETDSDSDEGYEAGERHGRAQGVHSFPRYRHLIQQERAYNAYRDEKLQQLPTMLRQVAAQIHHPDYALVVEGHGPSRPLHQPAAHHSPS